MARVRSLTPATLLQLRIELNGLKPAVWRRILVSESITLSRLHDVIQTTMGWWDCHLHEFDLNGVRYGVPDPEWGFDDSIVNESRKKLLKVLQGARTFGYTYDFGDGWEHTIKIEKTLSNVNAQRGAICIAGENACPPEDVGGVYGYIEYLEAIRDPRHPEHETMIEWRGSDFDPAAFDIASVNEKLTKIRC